MPEPRSIQGATALKLDEEINEQNVAKKQDELINGVSLENAAYFENNLNQDENNTKQDPEEVIIDDISLYEEKPGNTLEANNTKDETSPQLFSDEANQEASSEDKRDEILQNEDEDFEIPAFLRKQKF